MGPYFAHAQTRDCMHVQSAAPSTASVHILHTSKSRFKVLCYLLQWCILYTCPNLCYCSFPKYLGTLVMLCVQAARAISIANCKFI